MSTRKTKSLGKQITVIQLIQLGIMAVLLVLISYLIFRQVFFNVYYRKAQDIVNIVAEETDWETIEHFAETGEMDPETQELKNFYDTVKRNFEEVAFLYMFIPYDDHFVYLMEAWRDGDDPELYTSYGDIYEYTENEFKKLVPDVQAGKPSTKVNIIQTAIGPELSVWAPIFDDAGNLRAMVEADYMLDYVYQKLNSFVISIVFVIIALVALMGISMMYFMRYNVTNPISVLAKSIDGYEHGTLQIDMSSFRSENELNYLAESFTDMTERIEKYMQEVRTITAEKERIGAELSLATKIQADMLPNIFPAFPERPEFDVFASMTPAKEVGGDFYDFFMIDDDHMGLTIADVSGKGVPAALFMMMAKILIGNYGSIYKNPSEVLDATNKAICKNNDEDMFVTVWFGILTISTGHIVAANAGHEFPMIRKANGEFELLKDEHDFVVGGFDFTEYGQYEFDLEKGGTLFVYTDGLPEATNSAEEMFGTDRALEVLNRNPGADPDILVTEMKKAVDEFVGTAPQFDDLTMMAFTLK